VAPNTPFCAACGTNLAGPPMMAAPSTSGLAIAGFVCSFLCSVLGLILSIMGLNECKRSNGMVGGRGLAIAGIVISIVHIVFAIIMVMFLVVFAKKGVDAYHDAQHDIARREAKRLAYEAYPQWAASHPDKKCPDRIEDLLEYGGSTFDPWLNSYEIHCDAAQPYVVSAGPDGRMGTSDDIRSDQ
jgi:hypothetical protein